MGNMKGNMNGNMNGSMNGNMTNQNQYNQPAKTGYNNNYYSYAQSSAQLVGTNHNPKSSNLSQPNPSHYFAGSHSTGNLNLYQQQQQPPHPLKATNSANGYNQINGMQSMSNLNMNKYNKNEKQDPPKSLPVQSNNAKYNQQNAATS